jgi:hypothetical protein
MSRITAVTAAFAIALSAATVAHTTGPIGRQDTIKDGAVNPDAPNLASDRDVIVAPAPMPDSTIEGAVDSTISRQTEIVPENRGLSGIDGSAVLPDGSIRS